MKSVFTILAIACSFTVSAQNVGINTNTPASTLQVVGAAASTTQADGITIPSLTGNQLKAKDAVYTTVQEGTIVYITAAASPTTTKTTNVTEAGFYYFDGSAWQRVVKAITPVAGQLLNSVFIDDPSISSLGNFQGGSFTDMLTYSYTPVSNNSKIMVQYHNNSYTISGGWGPTTDEFQTQLLIPNSVTVNTQMSSTAGSGNSSFRTGSLFPIAGVANNAGTSAISIKVQIRRSAGDDYINLSSAGGTLIIQEIAR